MTAARAELEIVDLRTTGDAELLDELYERVYLPAFPIPEERTDAAVWKNALWGGQPRPGDALVNFLVAGRNLSRPESRAIFGFIAFEFFRRSRCGLLSWLAVAPERRRSGLGGLLVQKAIDALRADAQRGGGDLAAVFAEVNDPAKVDPQIDSIPPAERLRFMVRLGAKRVPVPYVQPALVPGQRRCYTLMLIALPGCGEELSTLSSSLVRAFLHDLYVSLDVRAPDSDPDFRAMVDALPEGEVALVPLT